MMKMHKAAHRASILKDKKGILTLDFIFATVLMFSFAAILFLFSITFSVMEVAQYAVFSSARAYFAAGKDEDSQATAGKEKFKALIRDNKSPLGTFFRNGWFEISDVVIDDFNEDFSDDPDKDSATFIGARATVTAKVLKARFPLLGQVTEDLAASPSAYLMREPSEQECQEFTEQRMQAIMRLKSGFANGNISSSVPIIMDDGC